MAKTAKTTPQAQAPLQATAKQSARTQVRRSGVHGKGVYALQAFEPGDFVIEYKGEHISWEEMERRHEAKEGDPFHTFFFQTESGKVIDGGGKGRNAARWINHSCEPNCETQEDDDGHLFITAIAPIAVGEEFFYDYALEIDEPLTAELKQDYVCHCGSESCRGTMLKTRRKAAKKSAPKKATASKSKPKSKSTSVNEAVSAPVQDAAPQAQVKRTAPRKPRVAEASTAAPLKAKQTTKHAIKPSAKTLDVAVEPTPAKKPVTKSKRQAAKKQVAKP